MISHRQIDFLSLIVLTVILQVFILVQEGYGQGDGNKLIFPIQNGTT